MRRHTKTSPTELIYQGHGSTKKHDPQPPAGMTSKDDIHYEYTAKNNSECSSTIDCSYVSYKLNQ